MLISQLSAMRLSRFFKNHLYIQISPQRLTVRHPATGRSMTEVPEIAVQHPPGGPAKILGVGRQARSAAVQPDVRVLNPFAHPRSLVSDFILAEQLLKAVVRQTIGRARWFQVSPRVVLHPLGEHEGGLTQVECRALRELAMGLGAVRVHLWQGPELTDEQVLSEQFPATGSVLAE